MKPVVSKSDDGRSVMVLDADAGVFGSFVDGGWVPRKVLSPEDLVESFRPVEGAEADTWLKKARTKFDAALDQCYGEQARTALRESGRDFGTAHISDGPLHLKFELPKKVSWNQKQLGEIAERIVASGEKVEGYLDVKLSVSESRYINWPPALQQQFAAARTVDSGKPSFTLSTDGGEA